jgi:transketolase
MSASHHRLKNLCAMVDYNHIQNDGFSDYARMPDNGHRYNRIGGWVRDDGYTANIMSLEPMTDKWRAFGWHVLEADGHDLAALLEAYERAKTLKERPTAIVCHTIKGKGVSLMENNPAFHGKAATPEELEQALAELAD